MINKVTLVGNLGRDPEVRHLENGSAVAKFSVATNENYKDKSGEWKQITEWHEVVTWRALAERAERDLKKGSLVYIEGKLTHRKWQDKDGNDRKTTEVVAGLLRPLDRRDNNNDNSGFGNNFPSAKDELPGTTSAVAPPTSNSAKIVEAEDDDLPF